MIFPVTFVCGGVYLAWCLISGMAYREMDTGDYFFFAMFAILFGIVGAALGTGLSHLVGTLFKQRWSSASVSKLAAIRNGDAMQGQFYLMGGTVNGGWAYNYYIKDGDQLRPRSLSISGHNIVVEEIDDGKPRIEVSNAEFHSSWLNLFALPSGGHLYAFFVPKGSVKEGFDI